MRPLVQIRPLIPEAETWGVNDLYTDVRLVSLRKTDDGNFELVVSNPDGTKFYTIVGQGGDWRLAEPGGKAGPATGKPEPPNAASHKATPEASGAGTGKPGQTSPERKAEEVRKTDQ